MKSTKLSILENKFKNEGNREQLRKILKLLEVEVDGEQEERRAGARKILCEGKTT